MSYTVSKTGLWTLTQTLRIWRWHRENPRQWQSGQGRHSQMHDKAEDDVLRRQAVSSDAATNVQVEPR